MGFYNQWHALPFAFCVTEAVKVGRGIWKGGCIARETPFRRKHLIEMGFHVQILINMSLTKPWTWGHSLTPAPLNFDTWQVLSQ